MPAPGKTQPESKQLILIPGGTRLLPFSPHREICSQQLGFEPEPYIWMKWGHLSLPGIQHSCPDVSAGMIPVCAVLVRVELDLLNHGRNRKAKGKKNQTTKQKELGRNSISGLSGTVRQRNLEPTVLTSVSCFDKGIYTVKSWELFKMPVSIIAVL